MDILSKHLVRVLFARKKSYLACLLVFLLTALLSYSQTSFLDSLQAQLTGFKDSVVQEKVFVHTDKTFYLTGETLWFKAYVVKADTRQPIDLSKVLYVELLDAESKPVMQTMIDVKEGLGDGSFLLPGSIGSGMYVLRAYTAWMKNFDAAFFFQTPVQIVNTNKRPNWASLETKEDHYAIQFFPEGGNLVEGIPTKLAFQLVNQYGKGVEGKGFIIENSADTIVRFHPLKFGIGSFDFTPKKNAAYKAIVELSDGQVLTKELPRIYSQGYVLNVREVNSEQLQITCTSHEASDNATVYLLVQTHGETKLATARTLTKGKTEWLINKSSIGEGITTFTLFDPEQKPVCERLYFKRPDSNLTINVSSEAKLYSKRSKVDLNITLQGNRKFTGADMSLSVFLLDSLQGLDQASIEEYFWLLSELKGTVESPSYYFSDDANEVNTALDNLMLTQGWRRIDWESLDQQKYSTFRFLPEYEGHIIRGSVVNRNSGMPAPNVLCYLSVPGERFYVGNAVSNSLGELTFLTKNIYGPVELAVQANHADSSLRIELTNPYSSNRTGLNPYPFILPEKWKDQLNSRHLNVQIANSFNSPVAQQLPERLQTDTLSFYGKPDNSYLLDEYTRFPTMEEVMREVVAEVRVQKESDRFRFSVLNTPYRSHFDLEPLTLLDGVPVFNTNKLIAFDPLKIKQIDVVARKYYWGNTINSGIVSYRTYQGDLAGFELDPGVLLLDYNGLQVKREFYAPVYATQEQISSRDPDRRNVLLWMPYLHFGALTKKEVRFYTSDVPGRYAVRIQGITSEGDFGSKTVIIDVK